MTTREMQISFMRELIAIDPKFEYPNTPGSDHILYFLNTAIERFVKTRYSGFNNKVKGFEETQKRIDDLRNLVTEVTISTSASLVKPNSYIATLPVDYLFTLSEECSINYNNIVTREGITETTADRYRDEIDNPFSEHVYHNGWARPLRLFYGTTVELVSDGTYTIPTLYLRYLRVPASISFTVDCDLAAHTHAEIVKIAIDLFLNNQASARIKTLPTDIIPVE